MEPLVLRAAPNTCWRCLRSSTRAFSRASSAGLLPHIPRRSQRTISLFGQRSKVADEGSVQASTSPKEPPQPVVLQPDDLFHPFTHSPIPEIRRRASFIRQHAYCPHPDHRPTRMPAKPSVPHTLPSSGSQAPAHVDYECPDCGVPIYCSKRHWQDDYAAHLQICDTLRQINEDDHDLRSGRFFPEFEYAGPQMEEAAVNMTNWDTFLYTREFEAINDDRSMRQVTRLLTYPLTIGSILHELSPYNIRKGGRLTPEGLKSLSALRYTLHPPRSGSGAGIKGLRPEAPPVRIFILGARAESSLPRNVWVQLAHLFPRGKFHLVFIGPESMANRDDEFPLPPRTPSNPFGAIVEDRVWPTMKISTIVDYYHTIHKTGQFYPYDPYFDCFVMFHPGLGHPASSHEWSETVPLLLETKAPILVTGYTQYDMERDIEWVNKTCRGEFDMLMEPGENIFRSLRWDLNDLDPQDVSCGNWGVWAFRGKSSSPIAKAMAAATPNTSSMSSIIAGAVPTGLKAPATSSTAPESAAAVASTASKSTASIAAGNRLPTRPISSDFLSDKATAALIRKTLCGQHMADRERNTPVPVQDLLPPLTSRNDVDQELYALISIIIREFVQNWYTKITPDETFVAEIVQIIAHCTRALEQRLRKVDLESLLFDELPELFGTHVRAYRASKSSGVRPPTEVDSRQIYHSMFPLPALGPVPRPDDLKSIQTQAENENAYRQILVRGVLAVLLPTEDLENNCLTSLVGQIFSELIINNLIAVKVSEPWLIWEGLTILARLIRRKSSPEVSEVGQGNTAEDTDTTRVSLSKGNHIWSVHQAFWSVVQWGFLAVSAIRLIITIVLLSWSLPPRSASSFVRPLDSASHDPEEKSHHPSAALETPLLSQKVPILDFHIWSCVSNLLEMEARMPWLCGALSMLQWAALRGPGKIAAYDGILDR
ncbi:PXA domain-containing protein [Biscogniauxia marginata]|nr:PXA domain-containing protein [Biscogniauxia marginata]